MASCARIENMLQAYADGELAHSDSLILQQHVGDCPVCARHLRRQQRISALMFEAHASYQLKQSLRQPVLEHLPEMAPDSATMAGLNWRAKNPLRTRWHFLAKSGPAIAAAVLLILALVLQYNWPPSPSIKSAIGMVRQSNGTVTCVLPKQSGQRAVEIRQVVPSGSHYETGPGSTLMLSLVGASSVKVNENSRVRVSEARRLDVEKGEIWLKVGRDGHVFRVTTPAGDVAVFGTIFAVRVDAEGTVVTVEQGEVAVERGDKFRLLSGSQQVRVGKSGAISAPQDVDVAVQTAWAREITPDPSVDEDDLKSLPPQQAPSELERRDSFVVTVPHADGRWRVHAIRLRWEPNKAGTSCCGYDVYVSDGEMRPLFRTHVDGQVFADPEKQSCELDVPGSPIGDIRVLLVRLVPDFSEGAWEPWNLEITAKAFKE